MPGPGLSAGGSKESYIREAEYWQKRASEPCPKCAERDAADAALEAEQSLRSIIRQEIRRAFPGKPLGF